MKRPSLLLLLGLTVAPRLQAQGDAAAVIAAARAQLEQFNPDSAAALLERALGSSSRATTAQRVRAYVLYGIAELSTKNPNAARQAFRRALQLSPTERVDSLEFLEPEDLLREFNGERAAASPVSGPVGLTVDVGAPFDTTLSPADGRVPFITKTSNRARVVVTVAPAETPSTPVWSSIEVVDDHGEAAWNLQTRDGTVIQPGRYVLRVTASDAAGRVAPPVERLLVITSPSGRAAGTRMVRVQAGVVGFATEPASTAAGGRFRVVVNIRDVQGTTVSGFRDSVMIAITPGRGKAGAHLSGTSRLVATGGVATFADLSIDSAGADYSLTATAANLASTTSISFDVTPGTATRLVFTTAPVTTAPRRSFGVAVTARDRVGNSVTGFHDTVAVVITPGTGRPGAGLSGPTRVAALAGVASFPGLSVDSAGFYTLTASTQLVGAVTSSAFSIVSWTGWAGVYVGGTHICGLAIGGATFCWGDNLHGQLGDGSHTQRRAPVAVEGGLGFTALAAGRDHTCGLTAGGAAYCWGENGSGALGDGSNADRSTPVAVTGLYTFARITAGSGHTCGVTSGAAAYCWGRDSTGELGDGSTLGSNQPVAVAGALLFASLSAGGHHTCGLTVDGDAYCWGWNYFGQLGDSSTLSGRVPVPVKSGFRFTALAAGGGFTCGLTVRGAAYCWGDNLRGELGDGSTTQQLVPVAVDGGHVFAALTAGDEHVCGLTSDGAAYCWGANGLGQLGDGTTRERHSPRLVFGGRTFTSLSASDHHTCGQAKRGDVYCWGWDRGAPGDGSTMNPASAVVVVNPL